MLASLTVKGDFGLSFLGIKGWPQFLALLVARHNNKHTPPMSPPQSITTLPWRDLSISRAANVLSDRWQRFARQQEVVTDDLEQVSMEDDIEQRAILYQLVETLPDDQQRVIIRRFVGQRSLREVATELGRSEGAIKQLQLRALQNLRDRIRSNHG